MRGGITNWSTRHVSHSSPVHKITRALRKFFKNDSAQVSIMAGLAVIPMFLAAGAAVDMVRINREQATFQNAVDAAVLAVASDNRSAIGGLSGQALADRIQVLEDYARNFVNSNYSAENGSQSNVTIDLAASNQAVQIMAHNEFPTTIMKMAGVDSVELDAFAEVKKAMRPIEMAVVMDTTGSMAGSRIDGAKAAVRTMLEILYGGTAAAVPESEYIRVALVPFAAGVRLNKNAFDFNLGWIDTTGTNSLSKISFAAPTGSVPAALNNYTAWSQLKNASTGVSLAWNGCVEARTTSGGLHNGDAAPVTTSPNTLFPAYFAPDTPYGYSNTDNDYIASTANEQLTMSNAQKSDTSNAGYLLRQENYNKYTNRSITAESMTGTNNGPWYNCAKSSIVPMTYKRANIESGITAMVAAGNTMIAEGIAWGLRAISPSEPFTKVEGSNGIPSSTISPYGDPKWQKIMVLVTDGDNDVSVGINSLNATRYSAYGRGAETLSANRFGTTSTGSMMANVDANMLATCDIVKAAGVELYTATYGSGVSTATKDRIKSCAKDADHYTHAETPANLVTFFDHIGQETLNKSIFVSK